MDLNRYVDTLRRELAAAAQAAGPDAESLAERLLGPFDAAVRLVVQDAVTDAADEISRGLSPGSVDVRLRGRDLGFVVDRGPQDREGSAAAAPVTPPTAADGTADPKDTDAGTARITVRLPETLKSLIEAAADREGLSVNIFLVRTLGTALQFGSGSRPEQSERGNRFSGWVQ